MTPPLRARLRGLLSLAAHLLAQTARESRRARGAQLVGCGAIFLVVLVAAAAQTVRAKAPLSCLREAEESVPAPSGRIWSASASAMSQGVLP